MTTVVDVARHWARQSAKGKGIRLEAASVDLLNTIGVGDLISAKAAELQRLQSEERVGAAAERNADNQSARRHPTPPTVERDPVDAANRLNRVLRPRTTRSHD